MRNEPRSKADLTVASVFGQITLLMTQSPQHKHLFLSDLEWLVMPPIMLRQFRIFMNKERPVGAVLWALASDEVAERAQESARSIKPDEWRSGSRLVIVDVVAPFGSADSFRTEIETAFNTSGSADTSS
ncbi:MAG: toxin-activating lysine-acyltransferase [Pseudomonadota bacterium]